jgi:hypothetical protein
MELAIGFIVILVLTILFLMALSWMDTYQDFTIDKGSHYKRPFRWRLLTKNSIRAMVITSKTMNYNSEKNRWVNKIFGFSGGWHHKWHSARFGWRPSITGKTIEIIAYVRDSKKIVDYVLCRVHANTKLELEIIDKKNGYIFNVNGNKHKESLFIPTKVRNKVWLRYMLFPYFGGRVKAPHNITIGIKLL